MHTGTIREKYLAYNSARQHEAARVDGYQNELRYIRKLMPLSSAVKFLDVGCGPGTFTEFMTEQGGVSAAGVDIDIALVASATARFQRRGVPPRFLAGRVEQLPYRDGVFDLCIANSLLEHALDWQATLREASRVLKSGGLLVFYTSSRLHPFQNEVNGFPFYSWLPESLKRPILAWIMNNRPDMVNYTALPAIHWFTFEQLKEFLEPLGYVVYTRLDLVEASQLTGWKALAAPVLRIIQKVRLARYLYYFYSPDVSVYALKRPA
jgi:ubiquinone/menaquinone biosynthesis C-methylase UbiE